MPVSWFGFTALVRDRVLLTIHPKRGGQESKAILGEDPKADNIHLLDERR
jgi:hypothetical protein